MFIQKNRITNIKVAQEALKKRANDYGIDLSVEEQNARAARLVNGNLFTNLVPKRELGVPLSSHQFREYLRDARFFVHTNNLNFNQLLTDVKRYIRENTNNIELLRKEVAALDATSLEKEIQFYQEYDFVHYNAFTREVDMPLSLIDRRWLQDYKTETSFTDDKHVFVIEGAGITLPLTEQVNVPFVNAMLIREETDMGDTLEPIISTDPKYSFLPDKIFRHVIIRKENDETTRKYNRNNSYCTLMFELPNIQLINYLKIVPSSSSSVLIESIHYINEANEEVSLQSSSIEGDSGWVFLFEPIRAKNLIVKFVQHAPVVKLSYENGSMEIKELNKYLAGINWEYRFDEITETIEGRVFDFSMHSIATGLNYYSGTGLFRSKDISLENIASVQISDLVELVPIVTAGNMYQVPSGLPATTAFTEYYLGLSMTNNNGTKVLEDLIPIPDTYPLQTEYLPIIGGEARVKLLPDLLWNANKNRILTATTTIGSQIEILTEEPHLLSVGETIKIVGPYDNPLIKVQEIVSIIDEYRFVVSVLDTHIEVTENTTPRMYLVTLSDIDSAFRVFKDGVELTFGIDYQINFGEVDYWRSSLPTMSELSAILTDARSGKMRIKFSNPSYESSYWITYYPYDGQYLGMSNHIKLESGRVVVKRALANHKTKMNTLCILRSNISNPYITVILRNYALKVKRY